MARYCEAVVLAEQATGELAATGVVVDGKLSPWFQAHQAACKTVAVLTLRLRLGPQSRQPRAHKTTTGPTSYYEIMELEAQRDGAKRD
jgi:phage terminase small subunit